MADKGTDRARRYFALLFGAAILSASCYPKTAGPPAEVPVNSLTWAQAKWPGTTAESLAAGRETFLAKCNGCHGYPDLLAIPDERWPSIMESMGGKSDLDAGKTKAVLQYVLAARHP